MKSYPITETHESPFKMNLFKRLNSFVMQLDGDERDVGLIGCNHDVCRTKERHEQGLEEIGRAHAFRLITLSSR